MSGEPLILTDASELRFPSERSDGTVYDPTFLDENKDWKAARDAVDANLNDIAKWDALVTLTEQLLTKYPSPPETVKKIIASTFDELLSRFPLFFGYWKKYTSLTYQMNGIDDSIEVLSRSIDLFSQSLELWIDYLAILVSNFNEDKDRIRANFEIAIKTVGHQFLSHPLWDKYIEFEQAENNKENVLKILLKVIRLPLHQYAKYYQSFTAIKDQVDINILVQLEGNTTLTAESSNEYFYKIFLETQAYVTEIWPFESRLKQSFFNLAPVPQEDFETWDTYLECQINKYKQTESPLVKAQVISIFERSLVPTALSPKFWYKYLNWYLTTFPSAFDSINSIYKRAINLFIPLNYIEIRLNYALFLQVHKQDEDLIHDVYLSTIKYNSLETKPIIQYIKFIARLPDPKTQKPTDPKDTCLYLNALLAEYFNRDKRNAGALDLHGKQLLQFLNDKTIAIIIVELVKINWFVAKNHLNVKKLLNYYSKLDILNWSIPFWTLSYKYYKEHGDLRVLARIIQFVKYESSLPISVINNLLLDYSEFLAQNFGPNDTISSQEHYEKILELEYDVANPLSYRIDLDPNSKSMRDYKGRSGHPGVKIDKPEITNSKIDLLASTTEIAPLPTFKNVEKANLPIEYEQDE